MSENAPSSEERRFPCEQCGAKLIYAPGTSQLTCEYCGHQNAIPQSEDEIRELDFHAFVAQSADAQDTIEVQCVKCAACAAEMEPRPNVTAFACPFCGTDIVATAKSRRLIKPKSLLPFAFDGSSAKSAFHNWIRKLWFAPNDLKKYARLDTGLSGMYVPYWTYDCHTKTWYTGERGEDYYVTVGSGKNRRRERRTRWYPASGVVFNSFDDVLVMASHSLPRHYAERLEPWDLSSLVPYSDEYLSGFQAESYQIDLEQGFDEAKREMDARILMSVRRDIGGDRQRVHSTRTQYDNITFKHILLPVWTSAYRYNNKIYRFLVNGRTGEVQGERPWSWIKITLFVLMILTVLAGATWLYMQTQQGG